MIKTDVKVDLSGVSRKIKSNAERAQFILDEQVLKDSNFYAPLDTGELIRSSLRMSLIGQGRLIWDTPYARINYYGVNRNFSKDKNSMAGPLWFEMAKSRHLMEWLELMAKTMGGRVG